MTRKDISAALAVLVEATANTGINIDVDKGEVTIYWNGVNDLHGCDNGTASEVIILLKRLKACGMKDC